MSKGSDRDSLDHRDRIERDLEQLFPRRRCTVQIQGAVARGSSRVEADVLWTELDRAEDYRLRMTFEPGSDEPASVARAIGGAMDETVSRFRAGSA
ncbi:MAG: hypothetical protein ACRD1Z_15620 [Vicinamibacteria bacterium]